MTQGQKNNVQVRDVSNSKDVNIAGGDLHVGFTAEQVSKLIEQISSNFQAKPFDGTCPYKGLDVFEEEDAELFFGREKLVADLVSRVKESRTIFVTGPSGSGKSSLVRAGLIHALKQGQVKGSERWLYATMKPGRDPFEALAGAFSRLKSPELGRYFREHSQEPAVLSECAESVLSERKDQRLVLFIDQFEEVFTQVSKEEERLVFLNLLTHAADAENGRVILLFSMRSDFVPNCAVYPKLNATLNRQFIQIGAMQPDELVSAIARPALQVGLKIDPDLIAKVINEMQGEPGALPLMQFAMKDLFDAQQAKGGVIALTLNDYLSRGGIHKALERHADESFAKLEKQEQDLARTIFSGLIEIGRGTQDTKRTALFDELVPTNTKAEDVEVIVQKLADARLITTDEQAGKDTVTISHEKLIDAWPWLRKLVNENRDAIALQNEIAEDAKKWKEQKRDKSYLYTGAKLANVKEQLKAKKLNISGDAYRFFATSLLSQRKNQSYRVTGLMATGLMIYLIIIMGIPLVLNRVAQSRARGEMVLISAGPLIIGSENPALLDIDSTSPSQKITLSAFEIGKYEVTNYQYGLCVKYGGCTVPHDQFDFQDATKQDYPVVNLILLQANKYCQWLGQRLPTQNEWERVARGPNGRLWPWGNEEPTPDRANMPWGNYTPTGLQPVNANLNGVSPEGVYNLIGNAWEWTSTIIQRDDPGNSTQFWDGADETYVGTRSYAIKGGGWTYNIEAAAQFNPTSTGVYAGNDLGFRCASDIK